ncbi:MAG: hypothetical protein IJU64_07105 [Bacilli bacterium]|nr:hypothetical protein [Bacilli bacterium]
MTNDITTATVSGVPYDIAVSYVYHLENAEGTVDSIGAMDMTDNAGNAWIANSAKKAVAYQSSKKYHTVDVKFTLASADAVAHVGETVPVKVTASDGRIRLAASGGNWYTGAASNTVTSSFTIVANTTEYSFSFFVSIKGQAEEAAITAGDDLTSVIDASGPSGTITVALNNN